ncbi:hypothetical protein C4588_06070 [Candidatus Parcubacteria bacterium]|nr:MAG: hypothetical protein C4588_06070 [Candidatus Parcubacteria bacterium]
MGKIQSLFHKGSITREGNKIIIDPVKPARNKWVNLYIDSDGNPYLGDITHESKEAAERRIKSSANYVTTIELKRKE